MINLLFDGVKKAHSILEHVVVRTPLAHNINLSADFAAEIFLKREDLQIVRSYKIRGAYNKMNSLDTVQRANGIICASAGNHAQGVAYSCHLLNIRAKIYMPLTTPQQKIRQVELFGRGHIEIVLCGNTFDDAYLEAIKDAGENNKVFIHPFDDPKVIAGQGTIGLELLDAFKGPIDYIFVPIGGGGLAAGLITVFSNLSPATKIIGVEPSGAASMKASIDSGVNTSLEHIDRFVDGAAVQRVGDLTFSICKEGLYGIIPVPEGKICSTIIKLYNEEAMVVEPAGALSIAALDFYREEIKGKRVVCIVSGSNSDISRTEEIKERALFYEGLKHYFLMDLSQKPGALKEFVNKVMGPDDDLSYCHFAKKNNPENNTLLVGIELKHKGRIVEIENKLKAGSFKYIYINRRQELYNHLMDHLD